MRWRDAICNVGKSIYRKYRSYIRGEDLARTGLTISPWQDTGRYICKNLRAYVDVNYCTISARQNRGMRIARFVARSRYDFCRYEIPATDVMSTKENTFINIRYPYYRSRVNYFYISVAIRVCVKYVFAILQKFKGKIRIHFFFLYTIKEPFLQPWWKLFVCIRLNIKCDN